MRIFFYIIIALSLYLTISCVNRNERDFKPKDAELTMDSSALQHQVSFKDEIKPIIQSNCASKCHGEPGADSPGPPDWNDFEKFRLRAQTKYKPEDSQFKLQVRLKGLDPDKERMPLGGPYLSVEDIALIDAWIAQGAKNN